MMEIKFFSITYSLHYEKFQDGTVKCIEDEIPFEVPDGWVWTRLGCITDVIQYGLSNSADSSTYLEISQIRFYSLYGR